MIRSRRALTRGAAIAAVVVTVVIALILATRAPAPAVGSPAALQSIESDLRSRGYTFENVEWNANGARTYSVSFRVEGVPGIESVGLALREQSDGHFWPLNEHGIGLTPAQVAFSVDRYEREASDPDEGQV